MGRSVVKEVVSRDIYYFKLIRTLESISSSQNPLGHPSIFYSLTISKDS